MYTIIEHIEYLLTNHDCVIIPGWGALVAQYRESSYNPTALRIERPERQLGFNASVNHNDGMLAHSLVRREGISYDEAVRFIGQSVSVFRQQLSAGGEVPFGRLGYFHSNDAGRIEFTPFAQSQHCDGYFGLLSVNMTPLALRNATDTIVVKQVSSNLPRTLRRYSRIAASVILLFCLTLLLTTPTNVNRDRQEYASLNLPTVSKPQPQSIDNLQHTVTNDVQQSNDFLADRSSNSTTASRLLLDEGGECYLVIASLTSQKQVDNYTALHPDLSDNMDVLKVSDRLYYVYVARSHDQNRLYAFSTQLPPGYENAWVKF